MQPPENTAVLEATAASCGVVVVWTDCTTGHAWCSKTSQSILGYAPKQFAENWARDMSLVSAADRDALRQALSRSDDVNLRLSMTLGDGAIASIQADVSTVDDGSDARIAVLRDVTNRAAPDKHAEIFDTLSHEARFTNCRLTNTINFGTGLKSAYGIDLIGTHSVPSPFVDHIHPDDREDAFRGFYDFAETTQGVGEIEFRLRRGDGTYAMVRERFLPERDASGSVIAIHSTVTDISDWHEERKRRDLLARASGRVVIDYDPVADRMQFSGAVEKALGKRPEDMPSTVGEYLELMHPEDRPVLERALDALRSGEVWTEPLELNYRLRHAEGRFVHFLDRSLTITDAENQAVGVIVALTDVSKLLRDREELRLSVERLKALADLSGQVVTELDIATGKVTWSGAVREQFGYAPEEMPQDPAKIYDMIHDADRVAHEHAFDGLAEGKIWTEPLELVSRARHKDGRLLHIQCRSLCVLDGAGNLARVLTVLNDVSGLMQQQERLLTIAEIASDAGYEYFHDEGRIIFNKGFNTCFGLSIAGEHQWPFAWSDFVHPDDFERNEAAFQAFVQSDETRFECEYRLRRGDGTWALVFHKSVALRDEDGRAILIIGTLDDVTEIRRTEARLREAVEALDSGFALYDENQRLVLHNRRFRNLNPEVADLIQEGVTRRELLEALKARNQLLTPDKAIASLTADQAAPINTQVSMADGSLFNVRFNPTASGDWVSLLTDVTDVVQDQQKLRAMFEVSADAMFDFDVAKGTITFDKGFNIRFGFDYEGAYKVPSPWEWTVHPEDYPRVKAGRDAFIDSRKSRFDVEFRMQRADGSWAYVAERAIALRDETGKAIQIVGAVADLTEQRLLEDKLHTAQKMESIGRISGGIAHDFNNLLAVVMGNAELLAITSDDPELQDHVTEIVETCKRGAELTRRLLSFARRSRLAPETVNVNEMVSGMGQLFARVIPESIDLQTSLQAGLWSPRVDPSFLESALLNLVINARDAMPKGGTLTIETANQRVTDAYGLERQEDIKPGRYIMLAVTDTGHGIPKDALARVVEPFFTTKAPNLGSGLGLSMVDGFVRQSGGLLRIYSEVAVGTTIKMLLPADPNERNLGPMPASAKAFEAGAGTLHVLLAEDEPKVRSVVARLLRGAGFEVTEAESGDAALVIFNQMTEHPDVLLTDVVMPGGLQGPMLARKLKELQPDLKIVFMSGYANEAAINGNGLRPDDVFLMKPIQREALLETLAKLARNMR
ncbi:MAG: PAS domain S-box protein [Rhodobacteraceae bacterium]|nr:MAG: PAS domain S-box protein [Paracoccaceae bacterium]